VREQKFVENDEMAAVLLLSFVRSLTATDFAKVKPNLIPSVLCGA
jgi:hypothetical protein